MTKKESIAAKRLSVCRECPHYTGTRCRVCGCFLELKARIRKAKCPLGKWPV